MISSIFTPLAILALAYGADVDSANHVEDQLFTTYVAIATVTEHVPSPNAAVATGTSSSNSSSSFPDSYLKKGTELLAIQWSNYRIPGVSHVDGTKIARDSINLYTSQPSIKKLLDQGYQFFQNNAAAFKGGNFTVPSDFFLKAVNAFHQANVELIQSLGFATLDNYLKTNLKNFDIGAGVSDAQHLVEADPTKAKAGVAGLNSALENNPLDREAYVSAIAMATDFADRYNLDGGKVMTGIRNVYHHLI